MSKNTRLALAIVGVLVIVVAAVVIGSGNNDTTATPTTPSTHEPEHDSMESTAATGATAKSDHEMSGHGDQSSGAAPAEGSGGASAQEETGGAQPDAAVLSPLLTPNSPKTVKAQKGDIVVIRARADKPATLHVHGYDKMIELEANETGRLKFKATIDGEFAIEMHYAGSASEVGTLRVTP